MSRKICLSSGKRAFLGNSKLTKTRKKFNQYSYVCPDCGYYHLATKTRNKRGKKDG